MISTLEYNLNDRKNYLDAYDYAHTKQNPRLKAYIQCDIKLGRTALKW